ncbi:HDOD domain-containing protein [Thalassotalea sp. LPB0316]|uniref:HDOD domain-containing protein n=1 Tax=Thalassotalea sp. LPB0316 TaxID=2769490 RepID=UPI001869479E|nr:HDOD domain-containing protein [Thalassotalea sp. LPB0316]QOL26626.1 HDOD domain-containing protein [Thalassotalea sp. LPB0316]
MDAKAYAEQASEIFVLSDSFIRIKDLIDDESSTIDDIADVILLDPALSATVLKLANSSFFNYPGKIDTISKAVLVLGITEVYNLVIAHFTAKAFEKIDADAEYLTQFWEKSVDCALIIKQLALQLNVPRGERLFILGLLHNLGELVVKQISPEKIVDIYEDLQIYPWLREQETLNFTFGECTAHLLQCWQLPISLIEPIKKQDQHKDDYSINDVNLLYVAKRVMAKNTYFPNMFYQEVVNEELYEAMGLDKSAFDEALKVCDLERFDVLAILNPGAAMIY